MRIIEARLIASTLWAHYRSQPLLNLGLVVSLALATATVLSILILNHASRSEYSRANSALTSPVGAYVIPRDGQLLSQADFVNLRQQGFYQLEPVLTFRKKNREGGWLHFKAIDLYPWVLMQQGLLSLSSVNIANSYATTLGVRDSKIALTGRSSLPVALSDSPMLSTSALLDIGLARKLFPEYQHFSYLMVGNVSAAKLDTLQQALPSHLQLQFNRSLSDRSGFADALHLNLNILAALGFIVAVLIAYQAASQAWRKRNEWVYQLRLLGIRAKHLKIALILEALILVMLTALAGALLAAVLASIILPYLGLTLSQIYALRISGHFVWQSEYGWWSLALSALGVLLSLTSHLPKISPQVNSANKVQRTPAIFEGKLQRVGLCLLVVYLFWSWIDAVTVAGSWYALVIKNAILVLASVILIPTIIRLLTDGLNLLTSSASSRFLIRDIHAQASKRLLPLAAFYLALCTSISASLMVNSFEEAFIDYLDKNLVEDLFVRIEPKHQQQFESAIVQSPHVSEYHPLYKATAQLTAVGHNSVDPKIVNVDIYASERKRAGLQFKQKNLTEYHKQNTQGCFINEQLSVKQQVEIGDQLQFINFTCTVAGIYFDYGNTQYEISLSLTQAEQYIDTTSLLGFGVIFAQPPTDLAQWAAQLDLAPEQYIHSEDVKQMALTIFNQTFILTRAIAMILFAIACLGLLLSVKSLELARITELRVMHSLGYSRRKLLQHMLSQWLILATLVALLSFVVATLLAHSLVSDIFPASFGWSMSLVIEPAVYWLTGGIGLLLLIPSVLIPLFKLKIRA